MFNPVCLQNLSEDNVTRPAPAVARVSPRAELWADGAVHAAGVLFAVVGGGWLVLTPHVSVAERLSLVVYWFGLLAMLGFSAIYNLLPRDKQMGSIWRRLDHAAIFIMIASIYTPLAVGRLSEPLGAISVAVLWAAALAGAAVKLRSHPQSRRVSTLPYLAVGWLAVALAIPLYFALSPRDFWLLMGGAAFYSVSTMAFRIYWMPFHRAIWHLLILIATLLQFAAVAGEFVR